MSKDIWHTPPQTPDVFKSHPIIVIYEAGDQIEQMNSKEYSDLVGERYVNRWCYVDDLIKENERTRKALDVAIDALKELSLGNVPSLPDDETLANAMCNYARDTLEQINQKEEK